jgi:hypothetical protein
MENLEIYRSNLSKYQSSLWCRNKSRRPDIWRHYQWPLIFIRTWKGHIGFAPDEYKDGDLVVVLAGGTVPWLYDLCRELKGWMTIVPFILFLGIARHHVWGGVWESSQYWEGDGGDCFGLAACMKMIVIFSISARPSKHSKVCTPLYRSNSNNLVLLMHGLPKSALIINCYDLWHFHRPFLSGAAF